jgi:hypothetical protein
MQAQHSLGAQDAPPASNRRKSPPEKRVRMERDALEGLLFRLFERQARSHPSVHVTQRLTFILAGSDLLPISP